MRNFISEFLGTFFLVFFGTGAVMADSLHGQLGLTGIALAFGLAVMCLIYALGDISGAHMNPAVSLAFWASGRFPATSLLAYLPAQLLAGILASITLLYIFPAAGTNGETLPAEGIFQAFALECILSFVLMLVILGVSSGAKEKGLMAGIAIGATVSLEALVGGPFSGASMNPARSLGPALVSGHLESLWVYMIAPVLGMLAAVPCFAFIHPPAKK